MDRIVDVVYEDGFVHLITEREERVLPYPPALLIHPSVYPLIAEEVEGKTIYHPHAVEVRAGLDTLIDIARTLSRLSNAFLFLPPERQFLLDKNISLGTLLREGSPVLSLPRFVSRAEALAYVLRSRRGYPPRVFVENVLFSARIAADLSPARRLSLPPDALVDILRGNLSPETVGRGEVLLPSTLVRVGGGTPTLFPSFWSDVDAGFGRGIIEYGEGRIGILADAEFLGFPYDIVRPITVSTSPGVLPRAILSILRLVDVSAVFSSPTGNIVEIALQTSSPDRLSTWYLFEAISEILRLLPSFLASTNALKPTGRVSLIVLYNLRHRAPELYKRLCSHIPICSRDLSVLESFLRGLSSLRLEPLPSSRYRRG